MNITAEFMCTKHDTPLRGHPNWYCIINEHDAQDGVPKFGISFHAMWCGYNKENKPKDWCSDKDWSVDVK